MFTRPLTSFEVAVLLSATLLSILFYQQALALLTVLAITLPASYLFICLSGLLAGRNGMALSSIISIALVVWITINLLIR